MNYVSMTLAELREVARSKEVKSITTLKKAELIRLLESMDEEQKKTKPQAEKEKGKISEGKAGGKIVQRFSGKPSDSGNNHAEGRQNRRNAKSDGRQPDASKYEARSVVRLDTHAEGKTPKGDYQEGILSDADGRQERSAEERRVPNIRNEAYTRDEFLKLDYPELAALDSKNEVNGILEIMEGYGFIRSANYLPGENDVYVSPAQIRRFNLKTGDILNGSTRVKTQAEKFSALLYINSVNGFHPLEAQKRRPFEELTPIFPDEKIRLEQAGAGIPMRIVDMIAPIGKGQRGMIVSPPKAGKTTLLKQMAKTISRNYKDIHLLVLLIDERPEEVTDIRESIEGPNVEVIYSTFDELPEHHKRVAEMVLDRAKRLVEHKKDVVVLLDSITRLARAYNLIVPPSGRTLTGGLDPAALHMPKKFFGAARNIREGGSLTILATALVETGSKMDDVVFEEFKGTGNMELVLDRKLSEKRIFPAIDISKSGTRRDDLLLTKEEQDAMYLIRREISGIKGDDAIEEVLKLFVRTRNNQEFLNLVQKSLGRRP